MGDHYDESDIISESFRKPDIYANTLGKWNNIQKKYGDNTIMWYKELEVDLNDLEDDGDYSSAELQAYADALLRADVKTELCRICEAPGEETGKTELAAQYDDLDEPVLNDEGDQLFLEFAELACANKHRWYKGEGKSRGIGGKNPILFKEHLDSRKRREIYCAVGTPDPSIVAGSYNKCVDIDTEALTPSGWKRVGELEVGMSIWAYDIDSDLCSWQTLKDIYRNDDFTGKLFSLESKQISARVTEGHRWAVVAENDKDTRYEVTSSLEPEVRLDGDTTQQLLLSDEHHIPTDRKGIYVSVREAAIESVYYEGTIWCPTVSTGFWMARRNGKVFVTGNTHPAGRKVNSDTQRKRHGASFYGN